MIRDDLMASTCKVVTILFGVSAGLPGLFPITLIPQNKIILKGRGTVAALSEKKEICYDTKKEL